MRELLPALAVALLLLGCGEPAIDLEIPPRAPGQVLLDRAGILDAETLTPLLTGSGLDIVAVTYESGQAGAGEARRAGQAVVAAWDADVVLVAVAEPGHFTSEQADRRRFFGLEPADQHALPGSLRERIAEEIVPPLAAGNDWTAVFRAAVLALQEEVG